VRIRAPFPTDAGRLPLLATFVIASVVGLPAVARAQAGPDLSTIRVVEARGEEGAPVGRYVVSELNHEEVRSLQKALREAGYLGVGWTGRLDDGTRKALARLQENRGLVECGCVSYETIVALGLRPEVVATIRASAPAPAGAPTEVESALLYPVALPVLRPPHRPCDRPEDGRCPDAGDDRDDPGSPEAEPTGATFPPVPAPPGVRPLPIDPRIRH
jgi:hypothetical protein